MSDEVIVKFDEATMMVARAAYMIAVDDCAKGAVRSFDEVVPAVANFLRDFKEGTAPHMDRGER